MQWSEDAWTRIDELMERAWALDPEERAGFLDTACADAPGLRAEVEALLAADDEAPDFLESDAVSFAGPAYANTLESDEPSHTDRRIGPYQLIEEVGRGGMSRVYRAERVDGAFDHEVAVKLLRIGLDSEEARQRFRLEQQVLATLQHPNVAQLLDGGLTDDDVPYLVMEHVAGQPITDHCETHQCSVDERLELLRTVGEALHYAHRNLVVHRDLKPSNILVIPNDAGTRAGGTVKLLDFGIAKLLDAEAAGLSAPATRTGIRPMTPAYAAPEQVQGHAVNASTDVYQFGVLMYEVLTGRRPYESVGPHPMDTEQAVLNDTPIRPSVAVDGARDSSGTDEESGHRLPIGSGQSITRDQWVETLQGDLDAIVMKALRTDPDERYASVEALVSDLDRYDAGRPVQAHPPTTGYRVRKFAQRHRTGVIATIASVLAVAVFILMLMRQQAQTAAQRDRAEQEAQAAEQVSSYLVDLFEASNPESSRGAPVTAQQLLQRGEQRINQLRGQPAVQARLLDAIGRAHQGLGHYDSARVMLRRSVRLRRRVYRESHPNVATGLQHLADVYAEARDVESALPLYRESLTIRRAAFGAEHEKTAASMSGLASALRDMGKPDSAVGLARQALTVQRRVHGDTHPEVLAARHTLAYALRAAGQYEQAAAHYRHVLEGERARYGPDHHTLAATHNDLAYLLKKQGHHASAVRHYREALAIRKRIFGPAHPKTTLVMQNLTGTLWAKEDYDAAEQVARQRLQVIRTHAPTDSSRLGSALGGLARLLADRGQFEAAIPPRRAVYRLYHEYLGATALYTIKQGGELGALLKAVGRDRAADSLLHRHHAYLEAQRDTILQQRDRYTRLDVVYSLRAMIRILEQSTSSTWARRYRTLLDDYTLEQSS